MDRAEALSDLLRGMARRARRYDQIGEDVARKADEEVSALRAQCGAVLALHFPDPEAIVPNGFCDHDRLWWPCPTAQALGVEW